MIKETFMKKLFLIGTIFLLFSGCSTLDTEVDYDTAYEFKDQTHYSIVHSDREGDNTLVNDRIKEAIKISLNAKEYEEVKESEADLLFVFHVNVQKMSDIRTDYEMVGYGGFGYGMGFGGYGRGFGTAMVVHPSTYKWTEGKLIIDALNPRSKKIVWRGVATDELSQNSSTPQEKTLYINKVVSKLMEKFPKD